MRNWLRARPERRIVVVSHGDFLRYITKGENDHGAWVNVEMREYTFAVEEGEDGDGEAWLVPVKEVVEGGKDEPTSSELQNEKEKVEVGVAEVEAVRA